MFLSEPFRAEWSKCLIFLFNENVGIFIIKTYSDDNKIVENMYIYNVPLGFFNVFLKSFSSRRTVLTFCIIYYLHHFNFNLMKVNTLDGAVRSPTCHALPLKDKLPDSPN